MDYLKNLTDDTGIFQHAKYCVPLRREGYTTDDNARALAVCTMYHRLKRDPKIEALAGVYLAFLSYMQKPEGNFHNYLSYERTYRDADGSDDSVGRALRALGCIVNSTFPRHLKLAAQEVFDRGLPRVWKSSSPRFYAQTILGLGQCVRADPQDAFVECAEKLAERLVEMYRNESEGGWRWFEPILAYDNAILPQSLFEAYKLTGKKKFLDAAEESMGFLVETEMVSDVFVPIGNDGWFRKGEKRAVYDQQPLEAAATVDAAVDAFYVTDNKDYLRVADAAFEWFLGRNSRKASVYCSETGGCFDGLSPEGVNLNQGAESCVSYLSARLKLEELKRFGFGRKT